MHTAPAPRSTQRARELKQTKSVDQLGPQSVALGDALADPRWLGSLIEE